MAAKSASKKRPASSQAGPSAKKAHLEHDSSKSNKKRSQPVTKLHAPEPDSDDESALDSDDDPVDVVDDDLDEEDEEDEDVDMNAGTLPQLQNKPKDPNASREAHKAQKVLQEQRRAAKSHSNLLVDAKRVWSLARQKNIPQAERQKHIADLMKTIRGNVKDIVLKHDASRIVQTAVKYGSQSQRNEIAVELKGKYRELAQSKYSKFLVTKLIRLCPLHRPAILLEFQTHVLKLLLHREASSVLADAFELHANAYERTILLRDFYGKEATLFSVTSGSEKDKERAKRGLSGVLEGADKEQRRRILLAMKDGLMSIFNNPDKGAITHAIVHRALWEYIVAIGENADEAEREKQRREIFENCQELLAEMVHTKDGSRVVREFLAQGGAKDRKQILKVLKPHVARMCIDDEAQLVLFTALDVTDDTKLIHKTLVPEMTTAASTLYSSSQGRRSILYLLLPRTRRHFTPAQIATLAETDEARSRTSKKASDIRENEVRSGASEALIEWLKDSASVVARDPGGSLVVADVMLFADGDKTEPIENLLKAIAAPYPSPDASSPHPVDLPHTSRMYKTLLQGGHFNHTTKLVEKSERWDALAFAKQFVDFVDGDVIVGMCSQGERNGAFLVAELCQALLGSEEQDVKEARGKMKRWFSKSAVKEIQSGDAKGKKILLDKLALL